MAPTLVPSLLTVADVKCYYCGFVSGEVSAKQGQPIQSGSFKPGPLYANAPVATEGTLRCLRCAGPVYIDDIRTVRPRPVLTLEDMKPKRGRPRRADVLARAS